MPSSWQVLPLAAWLASGIELRAERVSACLSSANLVLPGLDTQAKSPSDQAALGSPVSAEKEGPQPRGGPTGLCPLGPLG